MVPAPNWRLSGETLFDPEESRITTARVGGEWRKSDLNRVLLEYRSSRDLSEDVYALLNFRPFRVLGLQTTADYSLRDGEFVITSYSIHYTKLYEGSDAAHPRASFPGVGGLILGSV